MPNLQLVLFDLGGVVCHFVPERRLAAMVAATQLRAEDIQEQLWDSGFSKQCDTGRYTGAEMYTQICHRLGVSLPRREVGRLWALAFEPNAEVFAIAAMLRGHLPTGLLTDNPPLLREAFPVYLPDIERYFAPMIFSYQHGACKPGQALYEAAVRRTEVAAHATLLIDDAQTNVRGAEDAGWQAIHFTTPDALREALRALGVSGMGACHTTGWRCSTPGAAGANEARSHANTGHEGGRGAASRAYSQRAPNHALHLTASSVRSYVAPASGSR